MELSGLPLIISNVGSIVSGAVTWMGSFLGSITQEGNEILLLFCLVPIVGLGVGLVRRMLHV